MKMRLRSSVFVCRQRFLDGSRGDGSQLGFNTWEILKPGGSDVYSPQAGASAFACAVLLASSSWGWKLWMSFDAGDGSLFTSAGSFVIGTDRPDGYSQPQARDHGRKPHWAGSWGRRA